MTSTKLQLPLRGGQGGPWQPPQATAKNPYLFAHSRYIHARHCIHHCGGHGTSMGPGQAALIPGRGPELTKWVDSTDSLLSLFPVSGCLKSLPLCFPHRDGLSPEPWARTGPCSLKMLLSRYFTTATIKETKTRSEPKDHRYYMFKIMECPEEENLEPEYGIVTT